MFTLSYIKQRTIQILVFGYALLFLYWIWIYSTGQVGTLHNYLWGVFAQGIFPIIGAIYGFLLARKWGFLSSSLGRAIFFLSAGNILFGIASLTWGYYNIILSVEAPYPSLADVVYLLSYPLWAMGLINLGQGIGAGYKLRTFKGKAALVLAPLVGIALTYFVFISIAQGGDFSFEGSNIIKIFFDISYLLGDAVIITTIGLIYGLFYKAFGGKFKSAINILLIGFFVEYLADAIFSYTTTQGTYYTSDLSDLLLTLSVFLIVVGVGALDIGGITSRVRYELTMFAPRASAAINNLVSEIIREQARVIGPIAWDEAMKIPGLNIDVKSNLLSVDGDSKVVLEKLMKRHEELFGSASLEICKDAVRKTLSQIPQDQLPDVLR
ncbi:MAG: hypothetical protein A3D47_02050 [Candidatus Colwellbacteria bacterium RIFCSPHIGHO2_02_FULL_43_15]|uniref:Uncharacterized protein n=1 Tax=Candidatus Colwellbacteria bacterium RIFCSPHIGHO2_02_FULL_43_15 TaxID=1797686 RepID=A0A1G1Z0B5_9BACT|nr:MAG: hypothetical protein A3D47_02050 [Candidatus Colwellbacteria bacterium RIFCSPHIGHO2_02_FULL_43_15]